VDDEPAIQRTYRELARHYGFQVLGGHPKAASRGHLKSGQLRGGSSGR
jgi:hypothetical protein